MNSTEETRALATQIFDTIMENPKKHSQEDFCGTTYCIAGFAALIKHGIRNYAEMAKFGGVYEDVGATALGLNYEESAGLFYEMDNERAISKLKKVMIGEDFNWDDYKIVEDKEYPDRIGFFEVSESALEELGVENV